MRKILFILLLLPILASGQKKIGNVQSIDLEVTGTFEYTGETVLDTSALIIYPSGIIAVAPLVPVASWALDMPLKPLIFEKQKEELPLPLLIDGKVKDQYNLTKPYSSADVQILAEVEKNHRRLRRINYWLIGIILVQFGLIYKAFKK